MAALPIAQWSHLMRILTFCQNYDDWILNIVLFHWNFSGMRERGVLACWPVSFVPVKNNETFFVAWCDNCIGFMMWHHVVCYCYVYSTFAQCHINVFFSSHGHLLASHNQWPVACIQRALNFRYSECHHTKPRGLSLSFTGAAAPLGTGRLTIHTQSEGPLWVCDQPVAESSMYTAHNKHMRRTFMLSTGVEGAILMIERP